MAQRTNPGSTPRTPSPGEDVLRVIGEVESQLANLRKVHTEHQSRKEELDARDEAIKAREAEVARALADAEAKRAATEQEHQRAHKAIDERMRGLESREKQVERDRAGLERTEAELKAREQDLSTKLERVKAWEAEAPKVEARIVELEQGLRDLTQSGERARDEARREAEAVATRHREELEARDAIISEQAQEINDHREKLAVAKTKLQEVSEALRERMALALGASDADDLRQELTQREEAWSKERARLESRITELSSAKPTAGPERAALAQAEQVVTGLNREIEQVRGRLASMERENAALSTRLLEYERGGKPRKGAPGAPDRIRRRQERLALARRLVREQHEKLTQAGELIHQRAEECSKILAQRAELAQAHQAIVAMRRAVEARVARGKSAAIIFYSVLTVALIGGISWAIADRIAPATYISRATLSAETRGRALAEGELEEWQRFHESLVKDPQFVDQASEHMKRRGLASLSTPGSLKARMDADLIASSGSPGELVLEWRGPGAGRSARELDTLATSLASRANGSRARRVDGASTIVSTQAVPIGEPIMDQRPLYAGVIAIFGSFGTIAVGWLVWKRLSRAQQRFEHEAHLEHALDASNWPGAGSA